MQKVLGYILVPWLLLLPTMMNAFAGIGQVTEYKGNSIIERDGNTITTSDGVDVEQMDTAITTNGIMRIDFIDETRVDITEHSRLVIDEFVYDPANNEGKLSLKASMGTVRYASGQIAKKYQQNVKIRTPSATIGLRGTDFIMVVDEIGNSMITLLPSCDTDGNCYVGEITVDSDVGRVILNQAFQATLVKHRATKPTPPLVLPLSESDINNLLILRKRNPYWDEEEEYRKQRKHLATMLDVDFLEFDDLNTDALAVDEDTWYTDLDQSDFLLGDLLIDILDQLNKMLAKVLEDEFKKQKKQKKVLSAPQALGFDPETGITLNDDDPNWEVIREDNDGDNYLKLRLNQDYGYSINMQQSDFEYMDYRLGDGGNSIDIIQRN